MADPYQIPLSADNITSYLEKVRDASITIADNSKLVRNSAIYNKFAATDASVAKLAALLNIVQAVKTDTFENLDPNNVWLDIPDLSLTITPVFSGSKILLDASVCSSTNHGAFGVVFRWVRNSSPIAVGDAAGSRTQASFTGGYTGNYANPSNSSRYLDTEATSAGVPVVYKLQCTCETTVDVYINKSNVDSDETKSARGISTITAQEIPS